MTPDRVQEIEKMMKEYPCAADVQLEELIGAIAHYHVFVGLCFELLRKGALPDLLNALEHEMLESELV